MTILTSVRRCTVLCLLSQWKLVATLLVGLTVSFAGSTPSLASVNPPGVIELTVGAATPGAATDDFDGNLTLWLPNLSPNDRVDLVVVSLTARNGAATISPGSVTFAHPALETALGGSFHLSVPRGEVEINALAEAYDRDGTRLWGSADSVFVLVGPTTARVGKSSVLDLVREELADRLDQRLMSEEEFDAATQALLSDQQREPGTTTFAPPRGARSSARAAIVDTTTVQGNCKYVVKNGTTAAGPYRSITSARVQFVDRAPGGDAAIGSAVDTDAVGHYSAVVPGKRGDGTAVNLAVQVLSFTTSAGTTVAKVGPAGQRTNVYFAEGGPVVVGAATTTIDVVAGPETLTSNRAFSIVDAITVAFNFLRSQNSATGVGTDPLSNPLVFIEFPGTNANGSFFSQSGDAHLNIGQNHGFDWDVLDHEYGHYVQFLNGTSVGVGGQHFITGNNTGNNCLGFTGGACTSPRAAALTKDQGDKLAWGEGWPTFFGTNLQLAVNAATFGVPTAGDTRYDDTANAFGYDLESNTSLARGKGEDNELAVQRALWDLADTSMDESDEITFGTSFMWKTALGASKPITLSAFWNLILPQVPPSAGSYSTGNLVENQIKYGAILGDHGVSPLATAPTENAAAGPATPPTFKWMTQGAGGSPNPIGAYGPSYLLNKFKVKFYDHKFETLIFTSPEIVKNGTTDTIAEYTPSAADWLTITSGDSVIKWTVEGSSDSPASTTGSYLSKARTLNGVNIAFVIDDTGSMSEEIDGVRLGLTFFVSTLMLSPTEHPVIEVVTFKDNVTKRIVTDDLVQVQSVVDSLFASGGGDCPESSAEALQAATKDVIGSFASPTGKKGQILFVTDASPHAGYSLSGVKAAIASKGIDLIELLTGDCVDDLSPVAAPGAGNIDTCAASSNQQSGVCEPITAEAECLVCTGSGGGPGDPSFFFTSGAGPTPSAIVAFSDIAAAAGGLIGFYPEAKSGDLDAFESAITNAALGAVLPRVINVIPRSVPAGADATLRIIARNTNFGNATTLSVSGSGVIFGARQVLSPTELLVHVSVASDAATGLRDLTASTPLGASTEQAMGTTVLEIDPATTTPLITSVQPTTVARSTTVDLQITGVNSAFASGASTVQLGADITVNSLTVNSATALVANVSVGADAALGLRDVTVVTNGVTATESVPGPLNVTATLGAVAGVPVIISIDPGSGAPGTTLDVEMTGQDTQFVNGSSVASFSGTGITVASTTVDTPTHAVAHVTIASGVLLGFRDVTVETGPEQATGRNLFEVRVEDTGLLPPDKAILSCENKAAQNVAKLAAGIVKCQVKAAAKLFKAKTFDEAACEMKVKDGYDKTASKIKKCPACVLANAPTVRTAIDTFVDQRTGDAYCAGTTPLGGETGGFVPPDKGTLSCSAKLLGAGAKLAAAIVKCHTKAASAAVKGKAFAEEACEDTAMAKYDTVVSKAKKCAACSLANAAPLRNAIESLIDGQNGAVYCEGTVAFPQ